MIKRLTTDNEDLRMPAEAAPLKKEQVALFEQWIAGGAKLAADFETRAISSWARSASKSRGAQTYPAALPITAVALHNLDNALTVWTSGYYEAINWNLAQENAQLVARIATAGGHVSAIDISHDGQSLAVASGTPGTQGFVEVFRQRDGSWQSAWIQTCIDVPADIAFAPDRDELAIAQSDGSLLIATLHFQSGSSTTTQSFTPHADAILALSWSEAGDRLITGSRDRTAKIFDARKWQLIANYDRHERAVGGVAYINRYPVSLDETGKLRLWTGDDSDRTLAERDNQARFLEHLAAAKDRIWFAMAGDLRGYEIERKTVDDGQDDAGKPKQKTTTRWKAIDELKSGSAAWLLSLDADAKHIVAGNESGQVILWDVGAVQPQRVFLARP